MRIEKIAVNPDKPMVTLTAYIPDGDQVNPAVIVLPGGGYVACSKNEGAPVAEHFCRMGYTAFLLHYSTLYTSFNPDKWLKSNEGVVFPGPLLDVGLAVLKIKENAKEWHTDQAKIALCGFSAGGHLAACYITGWHRQELAILGTPEELTVAGAVLAYAVTTFTIPPAKKVENPRSPMLKAMFGTYEPTLEQFEMRSPLLYADEKTLPAFIWHTADDDVIPAENAIAFAKAMALAKVPHELHIFSNGPHASGLSQGLPGEVWPALADRFLEGIFSGQSWT